MILYARVKDLTWFCLQVGGLWHKCLQNGTTLISCNYGCWDTCTIVDVYTHIYINNIISTICIYIYMYVCSILYRAISKNPCSIPTTGVSGSYDFLELGQQPLILEAKEFEFCQQKPRCSKWIFHLHGPGFNKTSRGLHTHYKDSLLQVDDHTRYDLKLVLEGTND